MKAVVFDIGGVVILDRGLKARALAAFPGIAPDRLWRALNSALLPACRNEKSRFACWQDLAMALGASPSADTLATLWDRTDFLAAIEVNEPVLRLVRALRHRYKLGVISNTMHEHAAGLRELGIYAAFDDVVLSNEVGLTKDNPKVFTFALGRLGVESHDAVFVDDFEAYVEVARSVGMTGILFSDAITLATSLQESGVQFGEGDFDA